jgi:phosphate transport system substrate-binding protein
MISRRVALASFAMLATLACAACTRTAPSSEGGAAVGSASGAAVPAGKQTLTIKGSDTMVLLGQRWAESYMKEHSGTSIQVTGGGSGTGIAALINGSTDLCNSSRPMKDKEKEDLKQKRGAAAVETKVALDALAVYVADKNAVSELDLEQLAKIYKGELTNWKDLGGADHKITLYGRENNSGTYGYFKEHVLGKKDFKPSVKEQPGSSAVVQAVATDKFGMGYSGIGYKTADVKALKIKATAKDPAVAPTAEAAYDGSYAIARFLYVYVNAKPGEALDPLRAEFVRMIFSKQGQEGTIKDGYIPVTADIAREDLARVGLPVKF